MKYIHYLQFIKFIVTELKLMFRWPKLIATKFIEIMVEVDYNNSSFESSQLKTRSFLTVQAVLDFINKYSI